MSFTNLPSSLRFLTENATGISKQGIFSLEGVSPKQLQPYGSSGYGTPALE